MIPVSMQILNVIWAVTCERNHCKGIPVDFSVAICMNIRVNHENQESAGLL